MSDGSTDELTNEQTGAITICSTFSTKRADIII